MNWKFFKLYLTVLMLCLLLTLTIEVRASTLEVNWPDTLVMSEIPESQIVTSLQTGLMDLNLDDIVNPTIINQIENASNLSAFATYRSYFEITFNPAGPILNTIPSPIKAKKTVH